MQVHVKHAVCSLRRSSSHRPPAQVNRIIIVPLLRAQLAATRSTQDGG